MNTNENKEKTNTQQVGRYRPDLCFYHANAKGTGSAVKMNLHPAHDNTSGSIMLTVASQLTVGDRRGAKPTFSTFDWEHAICVKLDFADLTHVLQVLRGECESINEGKGLYHRSARGATSIRLAHRLAPVPGYMLEISRKSEGAEETENRGYMLFSPAEALGLCEVLSGAMYLVGFGIPTVYSHEATAA